MSAMSEKKKPRVQGVDEFLNHSTRSGGGAYLSGWKKAGSILVWLHTTLWSAPCWSHPIPHVFEKEDEESREKRLVVWSQRWVCHEEEEVLKRQYFYERESGAREYPPLLCPSCKVTEAVRDLYRSGKVRWTDPVFEWRGDAGEELVVLAGGMDGSFGAKDLSREQLRELRMADVRRDEAFKQDLRAKLKYMFCVVDDADVDAGLQKTFEAKGLGEKLKKAVRDEIRRARSKEDPEGKRGNPTIYPFPFEWTYDEKGSFDDRYDVLARTGEKASEKLLALLKGPPPDVDRDLEPGNCFQLRVELEEHCVLPKGLLDFDRCFEAAEKAGLMVPPEESKEDREPGEGGDGRPHEVRGGEEPRKAPTVTLGSGSPAWTSATWKPGANVRGADVVLEVPDGVSDEKFAAVRAACREAGAISVAEAVMCNHCRETMTTLDPDCPSCGARYDDQGNLLSRPCLVPECGGQAPLSGEGPRRICEKCGAIHEHPEGGEWALAQPEKPEPEKPAPEASRRARRPEPATPAAAPASSAPTADGRKRGVAFDQPGAGGATTARAGAGKSARR